MDGLWWKSYRKGTEGKRGPEPVTRLHERIEDEQKRVKIILNVYRHFNLKGFSRKWYKILEGSKD